MNIVGISDGEPLEQPAPTVIKVIGTGGGGCNAVCRMVEQGLDGVEFIAVNTDHQSLSKCGAVARLPIGRQQTRGLGAGGDPKIGESAAEEDRQKIAGALSGADMVFITTGMGGGTGTGSAPVIAQVAREAHALTVAVVTKPFDFEGKKKMEIADEGIGKLREAVDTLIIVPNQNLLKSGEKLLGMKDAFRKADDVLMQGVQGISDLITRSGEINIDFADVREFMRGRGDAIMGIGTGSGPNRALDAADAAMLNPMLEDSTISGASRILLNITSDENFPLNEFERIVTRITENACEDAIIKSGWIVDNDLQDKIKVTVVAAGFKDKSVIELDVKNSGERGAGKGPRPDFLQSDEFEKITGQGAKPQNEHGRNLLEIPTVFRQSGSSLFTAEAARRSQAG